MRYTNYPKQRYGYGEPQMTKREYEEMEKQSRTDKLLAVMWAAVMVSLTVALVVGLEMRGVI